MNPRTKSRLISWLIIGGFTLVIATLILVLSADYSARGFSNATFISGFIILAVFVLRFVANAGAFDLIGYSFHRLRYGTKNKELEEMKSASEYVFDRKEERKKKDNYYLPYIVVIVLFIGAAAILANI